LIEIGTTVDAFFSLGRLATFLRTASLGLKLALNLDGGPVACQGIALFGFHRESCGRFEAFRDWRKPAAVAWRRVSGDADRARGGAEMNAS
jgi:hypothetical protein